MREVIREVISGVCVRCSCPAVENWSLDEPDLLLMVSELVSLLTIQLPSLLLLTVGDRCSCTETGFSTSLLCARAGTFKVALTRVQIRSRLLLMTDALLPNSHWTYFLFEFSVNVCISRFSRVLVLWRDTRLMKDELVESCAKSNGC